MVAEEENGTLATQGLNGWHGEQQSMVDSVSRTEILRLASSGGRFVVIHNPADGLVSRVVDVKAIATARHCY